MESRLQTIPQRASPQRAGFLLQAAAALRLCRKRDPAKLTPAGIPGRFLLPPEPLPAVLRIFFWLPPVPSFPPSSANPPRQRCRKPGVKVHHNLGPRCCQQHRRARRTAAHRSRRLDLTGPSWSNTAISRVPLGATLPTPPLPPCAPLSHPRCPCPPRTMPSRHRRWPSGWCRGRCPSKRRWKRL